MLNLFIGVIVETMQTMHARSPENGKQQGDSLGGTDNEALLDEIRALRTEVRALRKGFPDAEA
jgi:voltage-gated sodium channel